MVSVECLDGELELGHLVSALAVFSMKQFLVQESSLGRGFEHKGCLQGL